MLQTREAQTGVAILLCAVTVDYGGSVNSGMNVR